jgi:hypothetical protein
MTVRSLRPSLFVLLPLLAAAQSGSRVVDSGTFSILVDGHRVATETFRMEESPSVNTVTAQLKQEGGAASQSVEMQITPAGDLKKYVWKETAPTRAQIIVEPQDKDFLVRHIIEDEKLPAKDTTHPVSSITPMLDDNYFSQMQVLLWKYMALGCQPGSAGQLTCNLPETRMPVFNPHQGESQLMTLRFLGTQKMKWKGQDKELILFSLKAEGAEVTAWMDGYSLVRVLLPAEHTEVLRD